MDLDSLHVPLALFGDDEPAALRERLIAALRGCAGAVGCGRIEVTYEEEAERLRLFAYVEVTAANLAAVQAFGELDVGDELGFDLWAGDATCLAFLGVDELAWEVLRDRGERALRGVLTASRRARETEALGPWLAAHRDEVAAWRRSAWVPEVAEGPPDDLSRETYYGGPAWLVAGEAWPTCGACGAAMELLLHLDAAASQLACGVERMFEVFQCTACRVGELARAAPFGAAPMDSPIAAPRCAAKRVVRWRQVDDYSGFAASDPVFEAVMAVRGDKLGGWPARLQGTREEPFPCPECRGETRLVFQLDSDGHAEWRWGDLGRAWLSVCPRHPERPLYFWECS